MHFIDFLVHLIVRGHTEDLVTKAAVEFSKLMVATVLCIGMAGSGKTTFMQRMNLELHEAKNPPYVINLDPAVHDVPFGANIDIRDSINYKKIMTEYGLGPNGAIMTSLNLFSTKIDQVINLVEKRAEQYDRIIVDTPGQIECFIWSASGQIITDSFASAFPTMIAYIVDTERCVSPATFMSNMLYACSILYKTKLPMIIVFNKSDAVDPAFAIKWMQDFEEFQRALNLDDESNPNGYMGSLMSSLSLVLEEFYNALDFVAVSSMTGDGFGEFFELVDKKVTEFNTDYAAERERVKKVREQRQQDDKVKSLGRVLNDIGLESNAEAGALSDFDDDDEFEDKDQEPEGIQNRYQEALRQSQKDTESMEKILRS